VLREDYYSMTYLSLMKVNRIKSDSGKVNKMMDKAQADLRDST